MNKRRAGEVRIIAGRWRGRKLPVAEVEGLRPSGDRARETLFNWLAPRLHGSRCLDLFAGTGALGFEAASRGAARVILVERNAIAAKALQSNAQRLEAEDVEVIHGDAFAWLAVAPPRSVDLAFVDPPFDDDLASRAMSAVLESGVLEEGALVYVETGAQQTPPPVSRHWRPIREKQVGQVRMQIFELMQKN